MSGDKTKGGKIMSDFCRSFGYKFTTTLCSRFAKMLISFLLITSIISVTNVAAMQPSTTEECDQRAKACVERCEKASSSIANIFECKDQCYKAAAICINCVLDLPCEFSDLPPNCKDYCED